MGNGGYTFLRIVELQQALIDVMVAACKRFGVKKAKYVISMGGYALREGHDIYRFIQFEAGIDITEEDVLFIRTIAEAEDAIKHAINILKEASNGK